MKSLCVAIMLALHVCIAHSQYTITNFNTSNSGLPNNNIFSVNFDRNNTAWIGTYEFHPFEFYGGLVKYDHANWEVLRMDLPPYNSFINNVTDVVFAPNDDMWVVSHSGSGDILTRWDSTGYYDMTPPDADFLWHGFAKNNSMWFASVWSGLYEYNYDSQDWIFRNNFPVEEPYYPITAMVPDSNGAFWISIGNRNMYIYRNTVLSKIALFPELPPKYKTYYAINEIAFASDESVWLGTTEGLIHMFAPDEYVTYTMENSNLPTHRIEAMLIDSEANVWLGTYDKGVLIWNGYDFIQYDTTNSIIGNNFVRDIAQDREGNIWIATWGGGVSKFTADPDAIDFITAHTNKLQVFPNPVSPHGELTIQCDANIALIAFQLISADGRVLLEVDLDNPPGTYTISQLNVPSGIYIGVATDAAGVKYTSSIAIE